MAFRKAEREKWEPLVKAFIEKQRPPENVRYQIDLSYSINDQSIEIFEVRPQWQHPEEKVNLPVAKATWVRSQRIWKIYWQRADLKWHEYDPLSETESLERFLKEVGEDPMACFWG